MKDAQYEQSVASHYLGSGDFDDDGRAYFSLYYREAKKGLGIEGALRIAEFALALAQTENRHAAIDALPRAISALRELPGSEEVQYAGSYYNVLFKKGVEDAFSAA